MDKQEVYELLQEFTETTSRLILGVEERLMAEIQKLRTELKTDMDELRTEFKTDMDELRTEIRTEMRSEFKRYAEINVSRFEVDEDRIQANSKSIALNSRRIEAVT